MTARKARRQPAPAINDQPAKRVGGTRLILSFPFACAAGLAGLVLLPEVAPGSRLYWSLCGAAGFLAAWSALLAVGQMRRPRPLAFDIVLRRQHYVQALAQASILLYWGWYWREVYDSAHLIAAQLLFAYAFDTLLALSRRDDHTLGFGPVPVVFSINLFLWFKPDWFYLQFVLIAAGFAAKELIRWNKGGRRVHIFNPSSLPLGVCSLVLLLTGTSSITWGYEIANTLNYAPHIYLFIFLVSLPGQLLFGVTTMTMSAVVAMYLFGLAYFASTGIYYFFDSYIPIAVFLGMHLLFNDPSTSPRTELGRILFGVLYAAGVIALYAVLDRATIPTFYDKLLAVPVMNLLIQVIDRVAQSNALRRVDPAALGRSLTGPRRNLRYVGVWAVAFIAISAAQGVGDNHRGQWVPFWQQACTEGRTYACRNLGNLVSNYCRARSGWACNEFGILINPRQNPEFATRAFREACDLGYEPGCANLDESAWSAPRRTAPAAADYQVILQGNKGPLRAMSPGELYSLACEQGFRDGCQRAGLAPAP